MRLGVIANTGKPRIVKVLLPFLHWLETQQIPYLVGSELLDFLGDNTLPNTPSSGLGCEVDFVLSFGGDGTFLQTARNIAPCQTPIIGVNLGGFGYLAEVNVEQLQDKILDLQKGDYYIQDRMMLTARAESDRTRHIALNDVVIDKGGFARTIKIETCVDGEFINIFNSDGLIIATPTGSTGYSLSAGGPILEPDLDGIVVVPICPHTLANRPLVVGKDRELSITCYSEMGTFLLAVDGQQVSVLKSGEKVIISRAPFQTRVVCFQESSFYMALRTKLRWRNQLDTQ